MALFESVVFKRGVGVWVGGGSDTQQHTHKLSGDAVQERKQPPSPTTPSPERHESQEAIVAAELQAIRFNCATARSKLDKSDPDACDYVRACVRVTRLEESRLRVTSQKGAE